MTGTSAIRGTASSVTGSSVSNPAAMSLSAEFFAPDSVTVPRRRLRRAR